MTTKTTTIFLSLIVILAGLLRFYHLELVPPGLHGDELGVGYNAWSLIHSGMDEYGKRWPLVFRADVAPLIFYATIPSVFILGLTESATRLPSALIGTITILVFYFFCKELLFFFGETTSLKKKSSALITFFHPKTINNIAVLSTLLLAITPWHIEISRIVHDASYGLLLQLTAVTFFFRWLRTKSYISWLLCCLAFAASFYAYHSPRLTTPLLLLLLFYVTTHKNISHRKMMFTGLFLIFVLTIPILSIIASTPLAQSRVGGINVFIRQTPDENIFTALPFRMVIQTISQIDPRLLFFDTSTMRYFNVYQVGLLYIIQLPLITIGYLLIRHWQPLQKFLLIWILIGILPGALTLGTANAGRILLLLPPLTLLSGIGMFGITTKIRAEPLQRYMFSAILALQVFWFMHQYFIDNPRHFTQEWQQGFSSIVSKILLLEPAAEHIIVSDTIKQPYIYVLFYGQKNPQTFINKPNTIRHSFIGYTAFGKYEFRNINWQEDLKSSATIIVAPKEEIPANISEKNFINSQKSDQYIIMFTNK